MDANLDHLLERVRLIAKNNDNERIQFIRSEHWIGYSNALKASMELQELLVHPKRLRMPNMLILGPTNNGKSKLIQHFCNMYPPTPHHDSTRAPGDFGFYKVLPILHLQMPPNPDVKRFYTMIMDNLGFEATRTLRTATLEVAVINRLVDAQVGMLVIDELHNILAGRHDQQREFLNVLRFLGNELKIPIVGVGTRDAYLAIRSDPQLENRFQPFILSPWEENQEFISLLASYAALFPLKHPSSFTQRGEARYILQRTEGILGEISILLSRAAELAIVTGREKVDEEILRNTKYHSPTERRKMMEQKLEF